MKNLTVNAPHFGNLSSIKSGNLLVNGNLEDIGGLADSLFMTQLDSASVALMAQLPNNSSTENPIEGTDASAQDQENEDVNPINLVDAMQLAAAQTILQAPIPALTNTSDSTLSEATLLSTNSIGTSVELLSGTTRLGFANQNLLNILSGNAAQALLNSSNLEKASPSMIHLPESNQGFLSTQTTSPVDLQNKVDFVPVSTGKNLTIGQIEIYHSPKPVDKENLNPKVSNLSDAMKNMGEISTLSDNENLNVPEISVHNSLVSNTRTAISSEVLSRGLSVGDPVNEIRPDQTSQEATTEKKPTDPFSGITSGFLLNPGFTNHVAHEASLKLEAVNTSLTVGPLHTELISAAKSGGGRILLEVNPDNAGPIRIDLQIDQGGQARLVVQGANESTQARLEQGSDQLRQQFAQMGLQLSLDMRQNSANRGFDQQGNDATSQFSNNRSQQKIASGVNSNRIGNENLSEASLQLNTGNSTVINLFA